MFCTYDTCGLSCALFSNSQKSWRLPFYHILHLYFQHGFDKQVTHILCPRALLRKWGALFSSLIQTNGQCCKSKGLLSSHCVGLSVIKGQAAGASLALCKSVCQCLSPQGQNLVVNIQWPLKPNQQWFLLIVPSLCYTWLKWENEGIFSS